MRGRGASFTDTSEPGCAGTNHTLILFGAILHSIGVDVTVEHPWGINHAGDYDLEELFARIDSICK